jgi:hypothetical protein
MSISWAGLPPRLAQSVWYSRNIEETREPNARFVDVDAGVVRKNLAAR